MKLCWEVLDELSLSRNGNFRKGNNTYIEKSACACCGDPYITPMSFPKEHCSKSCGLKGLPKSKEHIESIRLANLGRKDSDATRLKKSIATSGSNNPMFGKKQTDKVKQAISTANYRGGFTKNKLASYRTYSKQIDYAEEVSSMVIDGVNYLQVRCVYCNKWYIPKSFEVRARKNSLLNKRKGESLFYCSDQCKGACPVYHKKLYPEGSAPTTSREVQPELRKLVLERDNWTCVKCSVNKVELHCHHIDPVINNPVESADIDNCITLCVNCHKESHSRVGCRVNDLTCGKGDK